MKSPAWPGLEITLRSNGRDLKEHGFDRGPNQEQRASCYVESASCQNFTIEVKIGSTFQFATDDLVLRSFFDGKEVDSLYSAKANIDLQGNRVLSIRQTRFNKTASKAHCQKFVFGDLETFEKDSISDEEVAEFKKLGQIEVMVYRVIAIGCSYTAHAETPPKLIEDPVPHKALKERSISTMTSLDQLEDIAPVTWQDCEYPWGKAPILTLEFNYRSRHDLKIERVIPRTPSPVPLEQRGLETLTADEALEVIRILRHRNERITKAHSAVTHERRANHDRSISPRASRPNKRVRTQQAIQAPVTVIDLSEE